jgi:hypothetical protein
MAAGLSTHPPRTALLLLLLLLPSMSKYGVDLPTHGLGPGGRWLGLLPFLRLPATKMYAITMLKITADILLFLSYWFRVTSPIQQGAAARNAHLGLLARSLKPAREQGHIDKGCT